MVLQPSCRARLASSMPGAPRAPQENNFKAVLESIRDLMNEETVMPAWLHDIFLGYGDPAAARYTNLPDTLGTIDFKDTFLDAAHLRASFPGHAVEFARAPAAPGGAQANGAAHMDVDGEAEEPRPPFRVTFPRAAADAAPAAAPKTGKRKVAVGFCRARGRAARACTSPLDSCLLSHRCAVQGAQETAADATEAPSAEQPRLLVEPYLPPDPGPYPQDKPPENTVRFTPVQARRQPSR
jgi:intron-binding protein aquarius